MRRYLSKNTLNGSFLLFNLVLNGACIVLCVAVIVMIGVWSRRGERAQETDRMSRP